MIEASDYEALRHVPIRDGDLVSLHGHPSELFSVILVREGRCWLRNLSTEMDTLTSLALCSRVGHEARAAV